ncbi:hypothetical protein [Stackebrandtia soli]|uniref:hypothetical protein n=1 Tax=Stackebrandtia soli TaxID=1892856 RepID=UPI0039ED3686
MDALEYRRLNAERHRLELNIINAKAALTLFDEHHPDLLRSHGLDLAAVFAIEDRVNETVIDWDEAVNALHGDRR